MIDIISSAIRIGEYIRQNTKYGCIYNYYNSNELSESHGASYKDLLKRNFNTYGFFSFDYTDKLIDTALKSQDPLAQSLVRPIANNIINKPEYLDILSSTKELGTIISKFLSDLIHISPQLPILEITPNTHKLQHLSNELSTAVLRSGVLSWINNPILKMQFQQQSQFLKNFETATANYRNEHPYNRAIRKYIELLPNQQKKLAYFAENLYLIDYLIRNAILQGFFFEMFDVPEGSIIKIKELNSQNAIHPLIIRTSAFFPDNHIMFFRFSYQGLTKYILATKMTMRFSIDNFSTTIYGYTYPTNEYHLLTIK